MTDKVLISASQLRDLLTSRYELQMLESGGVDNWCGYSESRNGEYSGEESVSEYTDRVSEMSIDDLEREV